jgi:hypothetical protein
MQFVTCEREAGAQAIAHNLRPVTEGIDNSLMQKARPALGADRIRKVCNRADDAGAEAWSPVFRLGRDLGSGRLISHVSHSRLREQRRGVSDTYTGNAPMC